MRKPLPFENIHLIENFKKESIMTKELTAEWYWREDVEFATKPWRVVQKLDGRELQGRNVKREADAKALAENWATNPQRTGRMM